MKMCSNCRKDIPMVQPWHKCVVCGKEFCGYCGDRLIDNNMKCRECRAGKIDVKSLLR